MTQKQKVLAMLKAAGSFGVRSDTYLQDYIPRAAARIKELREEGWDIQSEREHQYVRYTLVGSSAGMKCDPVGIPGDPTPDGVAPVDKIGRFRDQGALRPASVASSEAELTASQLTPGASGEPGTPRSIPSFFDSDADWEAA